MSPSTPPPSGLLTTRALRVRIGATPVCDALNLSLQAGQCWALLGRNGTGKTTLLHVLAGLRPPAAGELWLDAQPLATRPRRDVARRLGLLPQDHHDAFPATVLDSTLAGRHPHLGRWHWEGEGDRRLARQALAELGLAGFEDRDIATLSGGERRRLGLATLYTQAPTIYLLDEPLNHLDLAHQVRVLEGLRRRAREQGAVVLMALHDLTLAARYCDHALLLFGEGEAEGGPAQDWLTTERLSRLLGHPIGRGDTPAGAVYFPA